ncbi:MAG: hypothetical protein ACRC92_23805 [Peptostreptococcaceae bacterium]
MELLQFDDLSYFKKICLDEETLIIYSKCEKYSFYINFKDEIKGVDYFELAITTEDSNGFINKSGTASTIQKAVMDTVTGKSTPKDDVPKKKVEAKTSKPKTSAPQKKAPFYAKKRGRR